MSSSYLSMKCLSLKQPYAYLLASGKKTIELRNWNTRFRGKFLIHSSKNVDSKRSKFLGIDHRMLTQGAIIGIALLYDVKQYKDKVELEADYHKHYADTKKFGSCKYGFMVENANRFQNPIPYRGKSNFFEVVDPIIKSLLYI